MTSEEELKARLFDLMGSPFSSTEVGRVINGFFVPLENVDEFENLFEKLEVIKSKRNDITKSTDTTITDNIGDIIKAANGISNHGDELYTNYVSSLDTVNMSNDAPLSSASSRSDVKIMGLLPQHVEKHISENNFAVEDEKGVSATINDDGTYRWSKNATNNQSSSVDVSRSLKYDQLEPLYNETMRAVKENEDLMIQNKMASILASIKDADNNGDAQKEEDFFRPIFETSKKPNIFQRVLKRSNVAVDTLIEKLGEKIDTIDEKIEVFMDKVQLVHKILSPRYELYKSLENIVDAQVQSIPQIDFDSLYEAEKVSIENKISEKKAISDDQLDQKTVKSLYRCGTSKPEESDVDTYKRITRDPKKITVFVDVDGVSPELIEELGLSPSKVEDVGGTFTSRVMMNIDRRVFDVAQIIQKEQRIINEIDTELKEDEVARGK